MGTHPLSLCPNRRGPSLAGCRFAYGQQGAPQDRRLLWALPQGSPRNCALQMLQTNGLALPLLPKPRWSSVFSKLCLGLLHLIPLTRPVLGSETSLKSLHQKLFPKQSPICQGKGTDYLRESLGNAGWKRLPGGPISIHQSHFLEPTQPVPSLSPSLPGDLPARRDVSILGPCTRDSSRAALGWRRVWRVPEGGLRGLF